MNRRRVLAAAVLTAVIAAVLAVIVYTEHANATETISVYVLTHNVTGGAVYSASDVQRVDLHASSNDFNYQTNAPGGPPARYARDLSTGDILRQDDLVPASSQAEIAVTVQAPPPLNAGDRVDVFAAYGGQQQALIGRAVLVETVSAGELTLLVPAADEQAWVAVGSSNVALHVARTTSGSQANSPPVSAGEAIRLLCGSSCAGAGPVVSPSP
jgi:hypothetical protein